MIDSLSWLTVEQYPERYVAKAGGPRRGDQEVHLSEDSLDVPADKVDVTARLVRDRRVGRELAELGD